MEMGISNSSPSPERERRPRKRAGKEGEDKWKMLNDQEASRIDDDNDDEEEVAEEGEEMEDTGVGVLDGESLCCLEASIRKHWKGKSDQDLRVLR